MSKRNINLYLADIVNAIEKIEIYSKNLNYQQFVKDYKTIDAVIRNFFIIGEAIRFIPGKTCSAYPEIPWKEISGMRNKIVHEYFGVDTEILWKTIKDDLPVLKETIVRIKS